MLDSLHNFKDGFFVQKFSENFNKIVDKYY